MVAEIEKIISKLNDISGVKGSFLVSMDGFIIAEVLPKDISKDDAGATLSASYGALTVSFGELKQGTVKFVIAEGANGNVFLISVEDSAVLGVLADTSANLGYIRMQMNKIVPELGALL